MKFQKFNLLRYIFSSDARKLQRYRDFLCENIERKILFSNTSSLLNTLNSPYDAAERDWEILRSEFHKNLDLLGSERRLIDKKNKLEIELANKESEHLAEREDLEKNINDLKRSNKILYIRIELFESITRINIPKDIGDE